MPNPRRLSLLVIAAVPLLGLAAFALMTATPIAAQGGGTKVPPPPPKCYNPSKSKATVEFMGGHPDRPLHKGCPPSVGKVIGKYCYTCDGHLDVASKWCYAGCKAGTHWNPAKKQCCG
jgi:hypothetical protein